MSDSPTGSVCSSSADAALGQRVLGRTREAAQYRLRLARSREDVRAAQTLRFLVFNLELSEGYESAYATLRDEDRFDEVCDHLIVEHVGAGEIVGTYRMQTGKRAASHVGYYSAQEFELSPFERRRDEIVELGRACVHRDHRNMIVLGLLWRGIAAYCREQGACCLMGCSSLSTRDPRVGASAYAALAPGHLVEPAYRTDALPALRCAVEERSPEPVKLPRLLRAYLSLGAKICGPPALDREFGTVDFLTWMELDHLPASAQRLLT